MKVIPETCRSR